MKKNANRVIDFRYAPDINQTCIGFADDYYKTIVREDGSLNYLWEGDRNQFVDGTIPACEKRVLNLQEGNLGFKYRYLPRFYHRDTLTEKRQDFGDPRAAVVITREEYQGTSFQWTTFAHRDKNGARMDIILFRMEAKPGFGHAKSSVYLQELGEASDPPETVRPISSAYALPVGTPRIPAPIALHTPIYRGKSPLEKLVLQEGDVWEGAFGLVYTALWTLRRLPWSTLKKRWKPSVSIGGRSARSGTPFTFLIRRSKGCWMRAAGIFCRPGKLSRIFVSSMWALPFTGAYGW